MGIVSFNDLQAAVPKLPQRDQSFALSLLAGWSRYGHLSQKQSDWAEKLVNKAANPEPPRQTTDIGNLTKINELFATAKKHLKFPAVVLTTAEGDIRLNVAGDRARVPGSINVVDFEDRQKWYGRILLDGKFEASPKYPTPQPVIDKLKAFAADPSKVGTEDGKLRGRCCFCMIPLTDPRSTQMGYGPVCAKHFGLEWGQRKFSF